MTGQWAVYWLCPAIGTVTANIMWLSSLNIILKIRATREIGALNPLPYVAILINCIGWTIYGCLLPDFFLFLANIVGIGLSTFYCSSCLAVIFSALSNNSSNKFTVQYLRLEECVVISSLLWGIVSILAVYLLPSRHDVVNLIGLLSCVFSVLYYASPLTTMVLVVRTADAASLYLPMIIVNLINAVLWVLYGYVALDNLNIWLPNGIGAVLASIQVMLYFVYTKKPCNEVFQPSEILHIITAAKIDDNSSSPQTLSS